MLHRSTLPRDELLVAFVLACGCTEEEAEAWRGARTRLAMGESPQRPGAELVTITSADTTYVPARKWTFWLSMIAVTAILLLLPTAGSAQRALTQTPRPSAERVGPATPIAAGYYRMRLPGSDRCLSASKGEDGRIRQLPCADAFPKRLVQPQGDGTYKILTQHPKLGPGCMGVRVGEVHDDYCGSKGGNEADRFLLEPAGTGAADRQIKVAGSDQCLAHSVPPHDMAPLWLRPCTPGAAELVFTFEPDPGRS
ncbi:RICIN domain-containing protein [Spongiactinospora sp. 9N601]|uniref:RICIN domain-containing protein n=1 Tax=Spongiactinospora sp. 9N601 TaxID=3375149 RepID=UPI00378A13BB